MLKIKEISKNEIPEFVLNNITHVLSKDDFKVVYKSEGMFGSKPDYLLCIEVNNEKHYGFVYNGNAPECSEFGSFGLNIEKTERVW